MIIRIREGMGSEHGLIIRGLIILIRGMVFMGGGRGGRVVMVRRGVS